MWYLSTSLCWKQQGRALIHLCGQMQPLARRRARPTCLLRVQRCCDQGLCLRVDPCFKPGWPQHPTALLSIAEGSAMSARPEESQRASSPGFGVWRHWEKVVGASYRWLMMPRGQENDAASLCSTHLREAEEGGEGKLIRHLPQNEKTQED